MFLIRVIDNKLIIIAIVLIILPFLVMPFLSNAGRAELLFYMILEDKQFFVDLPILIFIAVSGAIAVKYFKNRRY